MLKETRDSLGSLEESAVLHISLEDKNATVRRHCAGLMTLGVRRRHAEGEPYGDRSVRCPTYLAGAARGL